MACVVGADSRVDRYAVIGHPVAHSRSPDIHAAFAAATDQTMSYMRLPAEPDMFVAVAEQFFAGGGRGLNITLPFKQEAARLADTVSTRASAAGAVNTLARMPDGSLAGDNTDGIGLLRDLRDNLGVELGERRVLLLGAGGAVRGVTGPLLETGLASLVIANRTPAKAASLAEQFADSGPVTACNLTELPAQGVFDVVINAISTGLSGTMPALPENLFAPDAAAYDMIYADRPTPFLAWAGRLGVARRRDGFGMLVEQAAESFRIWRGVQPDTAAVIAQLRPDSRQTEV